LRHFLAKANGQLVRPDNGLSVVVVCCNDVDEYADAMESLVGKHGLVRDAREIEKIRNIDSIVVCLLGLMHHAALNEDVAKNVYQDESVTLHDEFDAWQYNASAASMTWSCVMPLGMAFPRCPDGVIAYVPAIRDNYRGYAAGIVYNWRSSALAEAAMAVWLAASGLAGGPEFRRWKTRALSPIGGGIV
jgi:hypothetical protein